MKLSARWANWMKIPDSGMISRGKYTLDSTLVFDTSEFAPWLSTPWK